MLKGVLLSILASVTFGIMYFYSQLLKGFSSEEVFAWRIVLTIPFLTILLWWMGDIKDVSNIWYRMRKDMLFLSGVFLSSVLASVQLWLFLWGPMHGRGLQVSLGYFLLPLVLVLAGSVLYGEKLSRLQWVAVVLAGVGVAHEIWRVGSIAWETALVFLGYAAYFLLRKKIQTDNLGGFWWDMVVICPIAIVFILQGIEFEMTWTASWQIVMIIAGLGLLSTIGLGSYILASRLLPLALFGLLGYLEPVLLVLASLLLGEVITPQEWMTYIPIWMAVLVLAIEGGSHVCRQTIQTRRSKSLARDKSTSLTIK